jgi:hypothetical protein
VVHEYEPAPQGVAYLDIGAGGYVDLGSDLTPEQLQALPFGRHVLGVIGTFGVDGYAPTEPSKPVQAEPQCQGDPGECEFNKACMYRCGRLEPPVQAEAPTASNAERGGWLDANGNFWRHEQVERHWPTDADKQRAELYEVVPRAALAIQQEAQPQAERKPLTEQEIWASDSIMAANGTHTQLSMSELVEVVRAVEAAHGIAAQQATDKKGGA